LKEAYRMPPGFSVLHSRCITSGSSAAGTCSRLAQAQMPSN
jgi:hypothetical protein